MMFSSIEPRLLHRDPLPWKCWANEQHSDECRSAIRTEHARALRPRPEFIPEQSNGFNPILNAARLRDRPAEDWADALNLMAAGKLRPNTAAAKLLTSAAQLGAARLVPFDGGWTVKGPRHYSEKLDLAIDHAHRVMTRVTALRSGS